MAFGLMAFFVFLDAGLRTENLSVLLYPALLCHVHSADWAFFPAAENRVQKPHFSDLHLAVEIGEKAAEKCANDE